MADLKFTIAFYTTNTDNPEDIGYKALWISDTAMANRIRKDPDDSFKKLLDTVTDGNIFDGERPASYLLLWDAGGSGENRIVPGKILDYVLKSEGACDVRLTDLMKLCYILSGTDDATTGVDENGYLKIGLGPKDNQGVPKAL